MKNQKTTFILLSLLFLLILLVPLCASAQEETGEDDVYLVKRIYVTVVPPRPGQTPCMTAEFKLRNYRNEIISYSANYEMKWYAANDAGSVDYSAKFETFYEGGRFVPKVYCDLPLTNSVHLDPANPPKCYVNGNAATIDSITYDGKEFDIMYNAFPALKLVNQVAIQIDPPEAGMYPDYDADIPADQGYHQGSFSNSLYKNDIYWYDETDELYVLPEEETFINGHVYRVRVNVLADDYCAFSDNTFGTVNGHTAVYTHHPDGTSSSNGVPVGTFEYTFPAISTQPTVVTQPVSQTVNIGDTVAFTVTADGWDLGYQWYYRTSSTGTWNEVPAAAAKTAGFTFTAKAAHHGYQYRCKVTSGTEYVYSDTATVKVKPKIVTQPVSQTVDIGDSVTLSVEAQGKSVKYQWEYRTSSSGTWNEVPAAAAKKASYTFTAKAVHNGYQYRCKVTNTAGSVTSSAVTIKVKPKITSQPANKTVSVGDSVTLSVAAEGKSLTYQWYYRTSSSGTWNEVPSARAKTADYTFTAKAAHHGYQYRCKVTSLSVYVYSKAVTVKVKPIITTQPSSKKAAAGATVTFRIAAEGKDLTYQWYYRTSSTGTWNEVPSAKGKKAEFSFTMTERHDGYQYRCKVTNSAGSVTSSTVNLKLK